MAAKRKGLYTNKNTEKMLKKLDKPAKKKAAKKKAAKRVPWPK